MTVSVVMRSDIDGWWEAKVKEWVITFLTVKRGFAFVHKRRQRSKIHRWLARSKVVTEISHMQCPFTYRKAWFWSNTSCKYYLIPRMNRLFGDGTKSHSMKSSHGYSSIRRGVCSCFLLSTKRMKISCLFGRQEDFVLSSRQLCCPSILAKNLKMHKMTLLICSHWSKVRVLYSAGRMLSEHLICFFGNSGLKSPICSFSYPVHCHVHRSYVLRDSNSEIFCAFRFACSESI